MSLLARRYATALHLAAKERGEVDRVLGELRWLHDAVADPAVAGLLRSPDVTSAERERIVGRLGEGHSELLRSFLGVVLRRRRQEILFGVHAEFRALVMAERGEVEGVVETPRPLEDGELARLRELAARLSGKQVELAVVLRPELIGGVCLRIGNELYDGSVKSALEQLEQQLLQASI